MTTSDNLFQLIKSLSSSEKVHFKKFVSADGSSKYIHLYNIIERQTRLNEKYNEDDILAMLPESEMRKNISFTKNYLCNLILESLIQYDSTDSIEIQLNNMMSIVDVLYRKRLFRQAWKILNKTKKLAYQYEKLNRIVEILRWEKILKDYNSLKDSIKMDREIYEEEKAVLSKLMNESEYIYLFRKLFAFGIDNRSVRSKKDTTEVKEIISHKLLSNENKAITFKAKFYYNRVYLYYYNMLNDYDRQFFHIGRTLKLFEENPDQIKKRPYSYYEAMLEMINCSLRIGNVREYNKTTDKIRSAHHTYKLEMNDIIKEYLVLSYLTEITFFNSYLRFSESVAIINDREHEISSFEKIITTIDRGNIYYQTAYTYFGLKDFKNALHYSNLILNNSEYDISREHFIGAKLLSFLVHFELNNLDTAESILRSIDQKLSKEKKQNKFEKALISFLKKILKQDMQGELIESFIDFKLKLIDLSEDPLEKNIIDKFNLMYYLESKISERAFKNVNGKIINKRLREKASA